MNSDKIMDGRVGFAVSYLSILGKYIDKKTEILKECHCLYHYYYETWNSYLNVCLLKKSDIIFQSWKSSSNNLFAQELGIIVILFFKSTIIISQEK